MPSRMERYYDSSDKTVTRTKRNRSLYDEIYEEKEYTNVEGIVKTPATENIDIEKIREMMRKYEDKVRTKRIDKTPKIEEIMEEDTPKNYDINDVLNKAMAEKKDDETTYHSLKNTEYNILKNLKINKPKVEEKEEIEDIFKTITNTSMSNKMGDKELSLDLLDELKSNNNTIIESSDAIRNILKEEIKQPKEDIDDDKDMDKSFYTKSLNLTDDLEGLDDKKESKTNKVLLRIFLYFFKKISIKIIYQYLFFFLIYLSNAPIKTIKIITIKIILYIGE